MENNTVGNTGEINQTAAEAGNAERTFTQDDVNRIVQERLQRERSKGPSEAERALEEREKAIAAKEREISFKATMRAKNLPEEVYEALNCTSEETFNKSLEILSPYFQKLREPILNPVGPTGRTGARTEEDSIRNAMGL